LNLSVIIQNVNILLFDQTADARHSRAEQIVLRVHEDDACVTKVVYCLFCHIKRTWHWEGKRQASYIIDLSYLQCYMF